MSVPVTIAVVEGPRVTKAPPKNPNIIENRTSSAKLYAKIQMMKLLSPANIQVMIIVFICPMRSATYLFNLLAISFSRYAHLSYPDNIRPIALQEAATEIKQDPWVSLSPR